MCAWKENTMRASDDHKMAMSSDPNVRKTLTAVLFVLDVPKKLSMGKGGHKNHHIFSPTLEVLLV